MLFTILLLASLLASCDLLGAKSGIQEEFSGLFPIEIRTAKSIVFDWMGQPDERAIGDFPGENWLYKEGPDATLEILFLDQQVDNDLKHWAAQITVSAPFAKRTKHGLRIGSSKNRVRDVMGEPDTTAIRTEWPEVGWYRFVRNADIYLSGSELAYIVTYDEHDQIQSFQQLSLKYNPSD